MADRATWARRVAEWRASGLTSVEFCEGRDFTAGGLRHGAHRLQQGRKQAMPEVRLVRVRRTETAQAPATPDVPRARGTVSAAGALIVELAGARITVPVVFDAASLAAVLDVVAARGATR